MGEKHRSDIPPSFAATEVQLRAIIDGVHDHAISLLDTSGHILTWNSAAQRIKGYSLSEVKGQHIGMLFTDADQAAGLPAHELRTAASDGHWRGQGLRRRKDGTYFPAEVTLSSIRDPSGQLTGFVKVTQDVTERRRAEDALRTSQAWLSITLQSIGDAVIATDSDGLVTFMNPVAEKLTGWSSADARGRPTSEIFNIVNERTRQRVENPVERVLREGVVVGLANHTALIARNGAEASIADSGAPIRDPSGSMVGVVLVFRDVTEERTGQTRESVVARIVTEVAKMLDERERIEALGRLLVPDLADWCVIELLDANAELNVATVSHADPSRVRWAREVVGRYPTPSNEESASRRIIRTGRAELRSEIRDEDLVAAARDSEHLELLRKAGFTSWIGAPLRARGRTIGVLSLVLADPSRRGFTAHDLSFTEDLGARLGLMIDNVRLYREALNASQLKDEFLAMVSHELRTPLSAVLGWARMLRRGTVPHDRRDRALEAIERNAERQSRLIDDLLDSSRILSGKLLIKTAPVSLSQVAELALEAIRPTADAKGVILEANFERNDDTVTGDADRLQQVIANLLSNAVKFTPEGGLVRLRTYRIDSSVEIEVRDAGDGIAPEFLSQVFERFRQADPSAARRHGGLGLGLAIAKQIVELHNGTIRAESKGVGQGATFVVRLPIAAIGAGTVSSRAVPTESTVRLDAIRVLVVDDEQDAREMLSALLTDAGAHVAMAGSVVEAMQVLDDERFDVIVSDIAMPDEDGTSFMLRVRKRRAEQGGRTPSLALSAYGRAEDRARAFAAGFNNYITKPAEPIELLSVVASLAGRFTTGA